MTSSPRNGLESALRWQGPAPPRSPPAHDPAPGPVPGPQEPEPPSPPEHDPPVYPEHDRLATRPARDQAERIQRQLDEALADSFPASDPVSIVTSQTEEDWA
jgi:hypothetical protein